MNDNDTPRNASWRDVYALVQDKHNEVLARFDKQDEWNKSVDIRLQVIEDRQVGEAGAAASRAQMAGSARAMITVSTAVIASIVAVLVAIFK